MTIRRALTTITLAAAIAASGCGGSDTDDSPGSGGQASSGKPIQIGAELSLSGYIAEFDTAVREGVELAVKDVNDSGGVLGRKMKLTVVDGSSDPQQGVRTIQRLVTNNKVDAIIGGFSSATTAAATPILQRAEVPAIVASVLSEEAPKYVYSTVPLAGFETGVRIDYLKSEGVKSVGILLDATPYAQVQLKQARKQLGASGIKLVGTEKHASDATDLRSQLSSLLAKKPEAILKFGAGPTNILAAKNLQALGAEVPVLTSIDDLSIFKQAAAAYPRVLFAAAPAQVYDALSESERPPALTSFINRFRKAGLSGDPTYPGRGWDAVMLFVQAVKTAKASGGADVERALSTMQPYDATTGSYQFTAENHYGITENPLFLARVAGEATEIAYKPAAAGQ